MRKENDNEEIKKRKNSTRTGWVSTNANFTRISLRECLVWVKLRVRFRTIQILPFQQ